MPASPHSFVDDLVRAALEGDRATFDRLFDLGFAALWRAAARGAPEGAEAAAAGWLRRAFTERLQAAESAARQSAPTAGAPSRSSPARARSSTEPVPPKSAGPTLGAR